MLKKGMSILILSFFCIIKCYGSDKVPHFQETDKVSYGKDTLHTYEHSVSGLGVIWIENKDVRKSFTLGVKTPTTDSTGVNHIIEHTVFTGSKSYPLSSLFFDANSAYPNLFMNALTSGDMTIFPFAASYDACYTNLLKIYLDSIFCPIMVDQPNGFYEESFHYNPDTKAFGGVVYNEMKGAYGGVDRIIYRSIRQSVYKGTHYENDSGGAPNEIPKLTYSDFVKAYKKYYYPQNMKIILYGDLPINEVLTTIDSYLKGYQRVQKDIDLMAVPNQKESYQRYAVLPEGQKSCLIKSFVMPKKLTAKEIESLDLWVNAYLLNPHSSFQKQIQKAGFANVKVFKDDDVPYPIYSIILQDIPPEKAKVYSDILEHITEELAKETPRDKTIEEDTLGQAKLTLLTEGQNINRGVEISQTILDGWAHERELYQYFIKKDYLKKINKLHDYTKLLFKDAYSYTTELSAAKQIIVNPLSLTQVTENEWKNIAQGMTRWQSENEKVYLKAIPLKELIIKPSFDTKIKADGDKAYITTRVPKGLARSQLYYNTSHVKQEELPYLFLYAYFLSESSKEVAPFRGLLDAKCIAVNDDKTYSPFLKIIVLSGEDEKNHGEIFIKARENLLTKDDKWYRHKLTKFTADFREEWSGNVLSALSNLNMGHEKGAKRYLYEQGYPLYSLCERLNMETQTSWVDQIKKMDSLIYNQKGLIIATTIPMRYTNPYAASWKKIVKSQPSLNIVPANYRFADKPQKSILVNDTQVDYVYLQYTKPDSQLDGADYLAAAYITKYYLTPLIRVQLGAYGAGCQLSLPHTISLFTYRDPDYKASMTILKTIPTYLEQTKDTHLIEAAKVEALSRVHNQFRLIGSEMDKADMNERNILMGIENIYIEDLQNQIIASDKADIQKKSAMFKIILEKGSIGIATNKGNDITGDYKLYNFK